MKVLTEKIENSQAVLQLEIEVSELDSSMDEAYHHLVNKVSIPGFRKGKVPRALLEQYVGRETFLEETLEHFIPKALSQTLEAQGLEAIARPEVRIVQTEPITVEAVVPLHPTVKLGDYKSIRLEPEPVEINDNDIDTAIEQIRHQQGAWVPMERPVQYGDLVTMDIEANSEGKSFLKRKDALYEVLKDSSLPVPGFAEKLIDMEKGRENTFSLSFPSTYETKNLAGKEFSFKVNITEIKEKTLPEIDDEFACRVGCDNLISLREYLKTKLQTRGEEISHQQFERKVIDSVVQICEVDYPPILLEREINQLLNEETSHFKEGVKGLEIYLKSINKSLEEHRKELEPAARQRLVRTLVLNKIAEVENIEVSATDVDNEIHRLTQSNDSREGKIRRIFDSPKGRRSIEQFLFTRKTIERLVEIAKGTT